MADRMKPHVAERVNIIRQWESDMGLLEAKDIGFKKYHNYYAPEGIVKDSNTVLSFGVGGECKFEKLLLHENENLNLYMFDPTPYTLHNIHGIVHTSGRPQINDNMLNNKLARKIKFYPYAYSHTNGPQQFYYDPNKEEQKNVEQITQSFSLIKQNGSYKSVTVECMNIKRIMEKFSLGDIDIIKADIEGLWKEIGDEILDNNIKIKMLATEFELSFDEINVALSKAKTVIEKFEGAGYKAFLNRRRNKLMLEMLFVRKDLYAG